MGTYSDAVAKRNSNLTEAQIRANKCSRTKARNLQRKKDNVANNQRVKLAPLEQLKKLDKRLGKNIGAHSERIRLGMAQLHLQGK